MRGLLDDPEFLLALAAPLLGARKGDDSLTRGLMAGVGARRQASRDRALMESQGLQNEQARMQIEAQKRAQEQEERERGLLGQFQTGNASEAGPTMPGVNLSGYAQALPGLGGSSIQKGLTLQQLLAKPPVAYQRLGPGDSLIDPMNPAKPIASVPAKEPDWKDPAYQKFMMDKAKAGASNVTTSIIPPNKTFEESLKLKKDFDSQPEVKGFKEVQSAWDQISTALKRPSAANDLAAATKFMKLLDPGSVVRESELMMAMQASGALDRFLNYANRVITGEKLTPTQRKDFYSSGEALYKAASARHDATRSQYQGISKKYGLDADFMGSSGGQWRILD